MTFDNIRRTKHLNMRKASNEKTRFFSNGVLCPNFPERIPLFFLMLLLVNILNSYFKAANNCWQSCKCSDKYSKALIATICWSLWKELKHVLYILHYLSHHKKKIQTKTTKTQTKTNPKATKSVQCNSRKMNKGLCTELPESAEKALRRDHMIPCTKSLWQEQDWYRLVRLSCLTGLGTKPW